MKLWVRLYKAVHDLKVTNRKRDKKVGEWDKVLLHPNYTQTIFSKKDYCFIALQFYPVIHRP